MNRKVRYMSIFTNLVFAVFLGFLIHNAARTMRVVLELNPLWFVLAAIAIFVFVAVVAEWRAWRSEHGKSKSTKARSQAVEPDPAKSVTDQAGGGQQPSPTQAVPDAPG